MATQYKLIHMLGDVIHTGFKSECELILKGLTTYGVREDKFEIVGFETESFLSENVRNEIIEILCSADMGSFDDGGSREIILDGASFPGLTNLSDYELVEQVECLLAEDDEILVEALAQKATYDMLKEEKV